MSTITEIAKYTGLSVGTVSEILRDRPGYKESTRQRVLEASRKLNYRPNELARHLRRQKSNLIGLLFPNLEMPQASMAKLARIEPRARDAGYRLLIGNHHGRPDHEHRYINEFLGNRVEGLILWSPLPENYPLLTELAQQGTPMVAIDSQFAGVPRVTVDRELGGYLQIKHLFETGRRRLMLLGDGILGTSGAKWRGWQRAIGEFGPQGLTTHTIPLPRGGDPADWFERGQPIVRELLQRQGEFDALVSPSDMPVGAIMTLLVAAGIKVPQELAMVGFDDEPLARCLPVSLTTIRQPRAVGDEAFKLLMEQLEGKWSCKDRAPEVVLEPELIVRASTAT